MSRPGAPITFSWHAARVLRAAGWSYPAIGQALGVSHHAAMYACDPYYRNRKRKKTRERQRQLAADRRAVRALVAAGVSGAD